MVLWVRLQCVIVVFPDHANLLLHVNCEGGNDSFCIQVQQRFRRACMYIYTFSPETLERAVAQWSSAYLETDQLRVRASSASLHCVLEQVTLILA